MCTINYTRVGVVMSNAQAEEAKKKKLYYEKKEKKAKEVKK